MEILRLKEYIPIVFYVKLNDNQICDVWYVMRIAE